MVERGVAPRALVWSGAAHPQLEPWAWWVDRPFYLRPESGGLLMCPCEEVAVPLPPRGRQPDTDPAVLEGLFASLRELAPHLAERPVTRYWTGLRTFAPDRRFVLGWDPWNPRLFWSSCLCGHGMTSGLAVTRKSLAQNRPSSRLESRHSSVTLLSKTWLARIASTAPQVRQWSEVPQPPGPSLAWTQFSTSPGRSPMANSADSRFSKSRKPRFTARIWRWAFRISRRPPTALITA